VDDFSGIDSLIEQLGEQATARSLVDARILAEQLLRKYGQRNLFLLAVSDLASRIDDRRRAEARRIEAENRYQESKVWISRINSLPPEGRVQAIADDLEREFGASSTEDQRSAEEILHDKFKKLTENPLAWEKLNRELRRSSEFAVPYADQVDIDSICAPGFREFLGRERYEAWYAKACQLQRRIPLADFTKNAEDTNPYLRANIKFDFFVHPEQTGWSGRGAWMDWENKRDTDRFVEEIEQRVRIEVTEELLSTAFATGDGNRVTWGAATLDQHKDRLRMLKKHIQGTAETAAMHSAAIRMIQEAGVSTLAEVGVVGMVLT